MGPGFRVDLALRRRLDPVVADGGSRIERIGDVGLADVRHDLRRLGVAGPHAREAVGHQLRPDGRACRARGAGALLQQAKDVLDVVAVLVGDHVRLREPPAARAVSILELLEEAQVKVDVPVPRAVERSHLRGGAAAAGLQGIREDDGLGRRVLLASVRERDRPVLLDAVDVAHDPAVRSGVGVGAGPALLLECRVVGAGHGSAPPPPPSPTSRLGSPPSRMNAITSTRPRPPPPRRSCRGPGAAADVAHLAGIKPCARIEAHGSPLCWFPTIIAALAAGRRHDESSPRASRACGGVSASAAALRSMAGRHAGRGIVDAIAVLVETHR